MPIPSDTPNPHGFAPPSSDQASYPTPAYAHHNAPEGNAYAQGGYATPYQALQQNSPLIYPNLSTQQPQRAAPSPFPGYYSSDPYAQVAWDWAQSASFTQLQTPYEPQGELIQEPHNRKEPANGFSSPLLVNPLAPPPRPLPQRPVESPKMKRKSDAEVQAIGQQDASEQHVPTKRRAVSRASSTASQSPAPTVLADAQPSPIANVAQIAASANQSSIHAGGDAQWHKTTGKGTGPQGREIDVSEPRRVVESSSSGEMLPAGRVFPIQIGSALFRLSGASICSDAPSYFSHFFSEQLYANSNRANDVRTLYIDRDPKTFRDIALHLQGYHIDPRDGEHFVKLFADAQFYSLPRLTKQLFKSDIFISIGGTPFRIPRDSFSAPGDSPNYFSLGFAQWFSTPSEVFPGLDRNALLRPPSIRPPFVSNKSGEIFAELMRMLQGYDVEIRNETHRANLLRDARYFHLKGLEQKLVPHEKSYNLKKGQNEILMRLEDIRQSGVSFAPGDAPNNLESKSVSTPGYVAYARPYTDDATSNTVLVLETSSSESATLSLVSFAASSHDLNAHVTFHGDTLRRMTSLIKIIASKMGLPSTQALGLTQSQSGNPLLAATTTSTTETRIKILIDDDCALSVDGRELDQTSAAKSLSEKSKEKWEWVVRRAQWRIRVEPVADAEETPVQAVLEGVKIEAITRERSRNVTRGFLNAA